MKTCSVCKTAKDKVMFRRYHRSPDGLMAACKACAKARDDAYKQSEAGKATIKQWRTRNVEKVRKNINRHYAANAARIQAQNKRSRLARMAANPESERRAVLRRYLRFNYNMEIEQFDAMVQQQNNRCAICGGPPRIASRLAVDHCHQTGKIRGLLCMPCNGALGNIGEHNLQAAIAYVQRYA